MSASLLLPVGVVFAVAIISAAPAAGAAPGSVTGECVMFCQNQPSRPSPDKCAMFCEPPAPPRDESSCGQFCVLNNSWDRGPH